MFKSQYCQFGGFHDAQIIGYKNLDLLQDEIKDCSLRRTKDVAAPSLPPKTITYELVEMSEAHRKLYDGVKNGVKEEADKIELNASNLLALTTRLRQATSAPSVLTSNEVESSKVERAADIVRDLAASGEKVVVLSNFIEPVYKLAEMIKDLKVSVNTGDQTDDIISKNVDRFQSGSDQAFIGTYGKVGTGLTLNAAAYMVCLDTPWT
jgi:SNF2 family DNA or RNA helicase